MKDALKAKPNYVMGSRQLSEDQTAAGDREEFSPTPSDLSTVDEEGTPATSPPPPAAEEGTVSSPPAQEEAASTAPAVEERVNGEVPTPAVNGEVEGKEARPPVEDAVNSETA